MKMVSDFDKVEVSIQNLHKLQAERRIVADKKALEQGSLSGLIRGLTRGNSQLNIDMGVNSPLKSRDTDGFSDLDKIVNKEERQMYELL